jgi:AraC-like DNA-binding protein
LSKIQYRSRVSFYGFHYSNNIRNLVTENAIEFMFTSLFSQSASLILSLVVALILLINIKRNTYFNVYLLVFFFSNFIHNIFTFSYELGWQNEFRDVPKPFNLLFLLNVVLLYQYIRSILHMEKRPISYVLISIFVPVLLFLVNLLVLFIETDLETANTILRVINFPVIAIFVFYHFYLASKVVYSFFWGKPSSERWFDNERWIRFWLIQLLVFCAVLGLIVCLMFLYELITQKEYVHHNIHHVRSLMALVFMVQLFLQPEILYGPKDAPQPASIVEVPQSKSMKPDFKWRTSPKEINNKQDIQLTLKFNTQLKDIIKKLDSKTAMNLIVKNPDINSTRFAEKLNIPRTYLRYFFKYHSDISFVHYRSKIRVHYAIEKMQDDYLSKNTMDALARECGFASYNPFYSAFKSEMGVGPSEVLIKIKP